MITAKIFRNKNGEIYGFTIKNHGLDIVCAAVSILGVNVINSIEAFTDEEISYECDKGYLSLTLSKIKDGCTNKDTSLLLNSFLLGLNGIHQEYKKHIQVIDLGGATNVKS